MGTPVASGDDEPVTVPSLRNDPTWLAIAVKRILRAKMFRSRIGRLI